MLNDTLWNPGLLPLQWGVVLGASLAAAVIDVRRREIPNALTFPLLLAGLVAAAATQGLLGVADAVVACIVLAVPYVYLFVFAGGGAGDAKLMAAVGAWLGVVNGLIVLVSVALSGVLMALILIWMNRGTNIREKTMPYGVAISSGVCVAALGVMCWRM